MSGACGLALAAHAWRYLPFIADDALISLRYAARLVQGSGLTWTDGERVEGFTNLLWVLLCAGSGLLGFDLITASRVWGVVCGLATLAMVAFILQARRPRAPGAAFVACGLIAVSGPVAVWTIGGLEGPLVMALVVAGFWAMTPLLDRGAASPRQCLRAGLVFGALLLTRPDGVLWPLMFGAAALLTHRLRRSVWVGLAWTFLPVVACLATVTTFRLLYYGDWVPNTWYLKGHVSLDRLMQGLTYFGGAAVSLAWAAPLFLLGGIALLSGHRRGRALALLLGTAGWVGYVGSLGGDYMPAFRHAVPVVPLLALWCGMGLQWLPRYRAAALGISCVLLGGVLVHQLEHPQMRRALRERWEWDGQVIGEMWRDGFAPIRPYIAVTAAGTLPYFSGLPALDMRGTTDRHIARTPPKGSRIGHDHADGAYVMSRQPDLIIFGQHRGGRPRYRVGREIERSRAFEDYRMVRFEGHRPRHAISEPWLRLSGPLGVAVEAGSVRIPAYLFDGATGRLGPQGMEAGLPRSTAAGFRWPVRAGRWRLRIEPPNPDLTVTATGDLRQLDDRLDVPTDTEVHFVIRSGSMPTAFRALVLERDDDPPRLHDSG